MPNVPYMVGVCLVGTVAGVSLMLADKLALYFGRKILKSNLERNQETNNGIQTYRDVLLSSACWVMVALVVIALTGVAIQLMKFALEPRSLPVFFKSVSPFTVLLGMGVGVFLRRKK